MAVRDVLIMGNTNLLHRSEPVESINDPLIADIIQDMRDTMDHYGGVGIAAPQIGYFYRIILFGFDYNPRYPHADPVPKTTLINPEIKILDDAIEQDWEGCLSVPGLRAQVPRYKSVEYSGYNPQGNSVQREAHHFHARVVQHEYDHIEGVLFPQRVRDLTSLAFESQMSSA